MASLIDRSQAYGMKLTLEILQRVVAENLKKPYTLSEDGQRIRAAQGHTTGEVQMTFAPATPPETLFHGTATRNFDSIFKNGIRPGRRHHAHLSLDVESAITVGRRHGKPVVLAVATVPMREAGHHFYLADNNVWLADAVPPQFLSIHRSQNATPTAQIEPHRSNHILPFAGIINFRDLGGYPTADGRCVRWRHLYRSARWTTATPEDAVALAKLGIDTAIDFRGEAKRERRPEHIPPNVRRVVHLPIEPVDPVFADGLASIPRSGDAEASYILMCAFYAEMVTEHAGRFRAFFAALLDAQGPVVFHCSAGKDRTGLAAALLLTALGVGTEDVYADYMASGPLIQNAFTDFVIRHGDAVKPFVEVDASYLDAAFGTIAREHGSVDAYLRDALQIDVGTLRSLFLE